MSMQDFIKAFEKSTEEVKVKISDRFPEFTLKAVSAQVDKTLRNEATERKAINSRKGQYEEKLNKDLYMDKLIIATVVEPNFKDAELQDALGVMGPEAVLNKLEAGEYMALLKAVSDINGFDKTVEEKIDDAKN